MTLAQRIAERANAEFERMAHTWENTTDFDPVARRRLVALLRTGTAEAIGDREVVASVGGPDVGLWHYMASDAMEAVRAEMDEVPRDARLDKIASGTWALTW